MSTTERDADLPAKTVRDHPPSTHETTTKADEMSQTATVGTPRSAAATKKPRSLRKKVSLGTVGVPIGSLAVMLLAWQFIPSALGVDPFVFPPLSEVVAKFTSADTLSLLLEESKVTIYEALLGLVIGVVSGILVGFLFGEITFVRQAFYPLLIAFQSLPKVAIAPLFVIWFGFGATPKVMVVAVLCFFPLLVNTMSGVMGIDQSRRDLFTSLCANRRQLWRRLLLPSTLPSIFAGLEVAVVFSLLGAITGEFVAADSGLGVLLQQFKVNYDTAGVFAVLILLSFYGVILNQAVRVIGAKLIFWRHS